MWATAGSITCATGGSFGNHSVPQMAVMLGEITAAQIRGHEDRNRLTRCLGHAQTVRARSTPRSDNRTAVVVQLFR